VIATVSISPDRLIERMVRSRHAESSLTPLLEGKVALITGAAGGIGRASALTFAREGAVLVLGDRDADGLAETAALVERQGGDAASAVTDVTSREQVAALVGLAVTRHGRLDCAFNNAGIPGGMQPFAEYSDAQYEQIMEINVRGAWLCTQEEIKAMLAGGGGSIVNASSGLGMIGAPQVGAYVTTKRTQRPPTVLRAEDPDYQRWFGTAIGRLATAEAAMLNAADQWTELARRNVEEDAGFSRQDDMTLNFIAREGMRMAWDVMQEHIVRTAGSSALRDGERLQRIYRDMTMGHGHFASLFGDVVARQVGQYRLGVEVKG
jgi:NADP-dependent 3-hydroxy acid dehydrogenase YdfG